MPATDSPSFEMSGCLAAQVTEARERVRVAVKNSGIILRPQKIMVNISPADIRKAGNGFDLPVAVPEFLPQMALLKQICLSRL